MNATVIQVGQAPRAALVAGLAALIVAILAGCGGGNASLPCDDATFRAQDEEVYVALVTAQNARAGGAPAIIALDLRRGAAALERVLATPPCDDKLVQIAEQERRAVVLLGEAADAIEAGDDASRPLAEATATLSMVQRALFAPNS